MQLLKKISVKEQFFFIAFFISFFLWDTEYQFIKALPLILLLFTINYKIILELINRSKFLIFSIIFIFIHKIFFNIYFDVEFHIRDIYFFLFSLTLTLSLISNYQIINESLKLGTLSFIVLMVLLVIINFFFNETILLKDQGACSILNLNSSAFDLRLFKENSHFGMIASIPIIYLVTNFQKKFLFFIVTYILICLLYFSFTYLVSTILIGLLSFLFIFENKKYSILFILFGFLAFGFSKFDKNCNTRYASLNLKDIYSANKLQKEFYKDNLNKFQNLNEKCLRFNNQVEKRNFQIMKRQYITLYSLYKNMMQKKDAFNEKLNVQYMYTEQALLLKNKMKSVSDKLNKLIVIRPEIFKNCKINYNQDINHNFENSLKNHENITVSVYVNSFLVTLQTLKKYPLGIGLNNYQLAHNEFTVQNLYNLQNSHFRILHPEVISLNRQDGRNNLLKIVTEFGIFSIFFAIFFIKLIYKMYRNQNILNLIFLVNICTQLLSGAGYINGGFVFSILILFTINFLKEKI
jgi:hypothetical protein